MRDRINTALLVLAFCVPALAGDGRPASRPVVRSQIVQSTKLAAMPDGNLFKTIESRDTKTNTDTIQRFDGNGNLVEKVNVSYQLDQAGNWTERTVSAWDPASNSLVAIRKDSRTLSYY